MVKKSSNGKKLKNRLGELSITAAAIIFLLIVALLLTIVNQAETRDIERVSGINKIREALQLYYLDKGYYPIQSEWCSVELDCNNFSAEIKPYLQEIPKDSFYPEEENGKKYSYQYKTTSDGLEYKIYADLEKRESYELSSKGGFSIPSPE